MLFGMVAVAALALGGLQLTSAFAAASERHAALHYADIALEQARTALVAQIAAQIQAGSPEGPIVAPSPSALAPVCNPPGGVAPSPCPFSASVSVTLQGQTELAGATNERALNLEHAEGIYESRLAATLVATVVSPAVRVERRRALT